MGIILNSNVLALNFNIISLNSIGNFFSSYTITDLIFQGKTVGKSFFTQISKHKTIHVNFVDNDLISVPSLDFFKRRI